MSFIENEADLQAEHQADKQLREDYEAEATRARWKAEDQAKRKALHATMVGIYAQIAKHLPEGYAAVTSPDDFSFVIQGVDCQSWVQRVREDGSWRKERLYRLRIGEYGSLTSYPVRKDGGYNWKDIALKLTHMVDVKVKERGRLAAVAFNRETAEDLLRELGLESYTSFLTPSEDPDKPVTLNFNEMAVKQLRCTVEDAREIAAFLRSKGIKLGYGG